jgi:hypothetical protein
MEYRMNGDQKTWIISIFCICLGIVTLVGMHHYDDHMERLSSERVLVSGISPALLTCAKRNWGSVEDYEICKTVFLNHKLTEEQAEKLKKMIQTPDR